MAIPEQTRLYTGDEFDMFITRPENSDRLFEHINGEIIEKVPGRTRYSWYGHIITVSVHVFCRENGLPNYTSGGDGAYRILGNTLAPDFAYKRTPLSDDYPDPEPPLWVVEIISPTDRAPDIREKRQIYRQAGILLWEIYPKSESVDVYAPGKELQTFGINHVLDVGDILPGFKLSVQEIFQSKP
jgi:Uma2 family endonuclease